MVRREALKHKAALVSRFQEILQASLASFRADPARALAAWTAIYPTTLPQSLMLDFYQTADYGFSPEHSLSLERFYRLAHEEGFLSGLPSLNFV